MFNPSGMILNTFYESVNNLNLFIPCYIRFMNAKHDSRFDKTEELIITSFLKLKRDISFDKITVAAICEEAEISRTSFYNHFSDTTVLLNKIMDNVFALLADFDKQSNPECGIPLCQFIRQEKEYQCIFCDDSLTSYIVSRMLKISMKRTGVTLREKYHMNPAQIQNLLNFQLSGCLAAIKSNIHKSDSDWSHTNAMIDDIINTQLTK